jgi:hypothetical protein
MTSDQINAKVKELLTSLQTHKNFLDSLDEEVVDALNDSCYYVVGAIESIENEIFDIENYLERNENGDDDDWKSDEEREAFMKEWGPSDN